MKNIRRLAKTGLILIGIVWLGFSFSGCGPSNALLLIVLIFTVVNTTILVGSLIGFFIWYLMKNKNNNGS